MQYSTIFSYSEIFGRQNSSDLNTLKSTENGQSGRFISIYRKHSGETSVFVAEEVLSIKDSYNKKNCRVLFFTPHRGQSGS